jgi:Lrp/AsnC family transcriptional regulator for asnA, asnC and gidA
MALAFVLVNTDIGREKLVLWRLRENPVVKDAYDVYGVYDIIVKVEVDNQKELQKAIAEIRKTTGVRNTITMIVTDQ